MLRFVVDTMGGDAGSSVCVSAIIKLFYYLKGKK